MRRLIGCMARTRPPAVGSGFALSQTTRLRRCLRTIDLVALGVGCTVGGGIYVVVGEVAVTSAGPAVVLSFAIAAFASLLAGLCYGELGCRSPGCGSGYSYSYQAIGELFAFITGWNLILSNTIGTSTIARALSANVDALAGGQMTQFFRDYIPHIPEVAEYTDLFALLLLAAMIIPLVMGVKESALLNNTLTLINLYVIVYVIVCGMFKADFANWSLAADVTGGGGDAGNGGFMPFGFVGVMRGASTCFFAFIGFDIIATAGLEAERPHIALPVSTMTCLAVCAALYIGVAIVITLMRPFYTLDEHVPLPNAFASVGYEPAKYIISIGSISGMLASIFCGMFSIPRVICCMGQEGLLFAPLGRIHSSFRTPTTAIICSGVFSAVLAGVMDVQMLLNVTSLCTILTYTMVAVSLIVVRWKTIAMSDSEVAYAPRLLSMLPQKWHTIFTIIVDQSITQLLSSILVGIIGLNLAIVCLNEYDSLQITLSVLILLPLTAQVFILSTKLRNRKPVVFEVPLVPWTPVVSVFINVYLMMQIPVIAWAYYGILSAIGLAQYLFYGIRHSKADAPDPVTGIDAESENKSLI